MRRSICYCEPSQILAGTRGDWKLIFTTAQALPKGAKLKLDLGSQGRDIDWEVPISDPKGKENVIFGLANGSKPIFPDEIEVPDSYVPQFEFTLNADIDQGENFTIHIGCPRSRGKKSPEVSGNTAQCMVQRRRPFFLYVDPKGKGYYDDPEVFLMDVQGNVMENIRILAPSMVGKNKRFDVVLRFEDAYGNLTSNAPEGTLIELTHEQQRENLNWKLFVPETGFLMLPNIYFNEEGDYTITLHNTHTGDKFRSAPIRCVTEVKKNLFWGLLHGESERVDSTEHIPQCLRHFRDEKAFNFFATSAFESVEETPNDIWKSMGQSVAEYNEEDRFVSYLGFQWQGDGKSEGIRQFVYLKDNKPLLRKKDSKYNQLEKVYKTISPKEVLSIPCFSMAKGLGCDFDHFYPEFERVVEIYNAWGSSECTAKEGNRMPITGKGRGSVREWADGSVLNALKRNLRFGFVAGGLDDRGVYADLFDADQEQYSPGLTGVLATDQTRDGIMSALYNRSCYATSGARIILSFQMAGTEMGQEVSTDDKPGLAFCRHISGHVAGTEDLLKVELIRNGEVIKTFEPKNSYHCDFTYDDMDAVDKIALDAKDGKPPFIFYYVRVTQSDFHVAWSSPIWLDLSEDMVKPAKRTRKKA